MSSGGLFGLDSVKKTMIDAKIFCHPPPPKRLAPEDRQNGYTCAQLHTSLSFPLFVSLPLTGAYDCKQDVKFPVSVYVTKHVWVLCARDNLSACSFAFLLYVQHSSIGFSYTKLSRIWLC